MIPLPAQPAPVSPIPVYQWCRKPYRHRRSTRRPVPLTAVQISTPALMFRQAQCSRALLRAVAMRMLCAGRQLRLVEAGKLEQGAINVALGGLHVLTSTASLLPPGLERGLTLSRRAIGFIRHDNICRGELVAEIVVVDRFSSSSWRGSNRQSVARSSSHGSYTGAVSKSRICLG